MRIALLIATGLLVTACDASETDETTAPAADTAMTGMDGTNPDMMSVDMPATPQAYVDRAAISDMYEIEAGKLAIRQASSAETRALARTMVEDHTASTRDLTAAADQSETEITVPAELDTEHQAMLDVLENLEGENFDREYMNQQMTAHRRALALHEAYAERGDDPALQAFAVEVVPVIREHHERLERESAAWTGTADTGAATGEDDAMTPAQ